MSPDSATSDTITEGIRIRAKAQYVPDRSDPDRKRYHYRYHIVISNEGGRQAKLRARHWIILDAQNNRHEVRGPGVVGAEPSLAPGETFEYTSSSDLPSSWGTMEGSYLMERQDGSQFQAAIGRFFLAPNNPPL